VAYDNNCNENCEARVRIRVFSNLMPQSNENKKINYMFLNCGLR
jgi:hypothetical protein